MTKIFKNKFVLTLFLVLVSFSAFADEPNPSEPPEDVPGAPIDSYIFGLIILGIMLAYKFLAKTKMLISKN